MLRSNGDEAALQERADTEQVFLACKVAVAQAIAACRDQPQAQLASATRSSTAVKVTMRGVGPGLVSVKGAFQWVDAPQRSCLVCTMC